MENRMTKLEYLQDKGRRCPVCTSYDLDVSKVLEHAVVNAGPIHHVHGRVECQECGSEWTDVYVLAGYRMLDQFQNQPFRKDTHEIPDTRKDAPVDSGTGPRSERGGTGQDRLDPEQWAKDSLDHPGDA